MDVLGVGGEGDVFCFCWLLPVFVGGCVVSGDVMGCGCEFLGGVAFSAAVV